MHAYKYLSSFFLKYTFSVFLLFLLFPLTGIAQKKNPKPLNYSLKSNWATLPGNDPANIKDYIQDSSWIKKADVFYVYPTFLVDKKDTSWNADITSSSHRTTVITKAIEFQASAWAEAGRMFVPFYRQAHVRSYHQLENNGRNSLLFAYEDVRAAFLYYLENYNNGRPIIFAGHSQGSTHICLLLKEFFDDKDLSKQLIIAYIPGMGIEKKMFSKIPLLTKYNTIGGYVTWNTFKKKLNKEKYNKWYKGKQVINPVTWDLSKKADRKLHKGFFFSNRKMYKNAFTTYLIDGVIWITKPKFPYKSLSFAMKDYHVGDVNLFWEDIRLNTKHRLVHWFSKEDSSKTMKK